MTNGLSYAFLHGGGQAGWVWDETLVALEQQLRGRSYRATAFDLPGCGRKRDVDVSNLTVRDVATAFASDLAASGLRDVILVGHSNAGTIIPLVAQMVPELIRHYVYVSCLAPAPGQSVRQLMSAGPHGVGESEAPSVMRLRPLFCNDMDEAQATRFLAKLGKDHWPTLKSLEEQGWCYDHLHGRSATYVLCLRDQTLVPDWQEQFALRLHVRDIVRVHAGHQVMNTRPQALAEILVHAARLTA